MDYSDRVLLTIHGASSDNSGMRSLRDACKAQLPGLIVENPYYNNVALWQALNEVTRKIIFDAVYEKIWSVAKRHDVGNKRKLYVVAHSLGTLAVFQALQRNLVDAPIEGLVLLGSIIPRAANWDGHVRSGQLKYPPFAIIRPFDHAVRASRRIGGEPSGRQGFIPNGQFAPLETYKRGGHNSYYPDDVKDIVTVISQGVESVGRQSYDDLRNDCPLHERIRLPRTL